jgi:hypothetical protein
MASDRPRHLLVLGVLSFYLRFLQHDVSINETVSGEFGQLYLRKLTIEQRHRVQNGLKFCGVFLQRHNDKR